VENLQGGIELVRIDPSQVLAFDFAVREVAEVARRVAGIGDSNIAQRRAAAPKQAHYVPSSRTDGRHSISNRRCLASEVRLVRPSVWVHTGFTLYTETLTF
jgi:hypothetical protein